MSVKKILLIVVGCFFGLLLLFIASFLLATMLFGDRQNNFVDGAGVGMVAAGAYDLVGHTRSETPPAQIYVDETYIPAGEETYMPADLPEVAPDQLSDETRANLDWNQRVECVVDEDGWLTKSDGRPVYIAPTDDPQLSDETRANLDWNQQ